MQKHMNQPRFCLCPIHGPMNLVLDRGPDTLIGRMFCLGSNLDECTGGWSYNGGHLAVIWLFAILLWTLVYFALTVVIICIE